MTDVSRETPSAPKVARRAFPDALPTLEAYAELLATDGIVRGLLGPREVPRLWERHLLNCAVLGELVPTNASVADIGTGAGLPGLVLAIVRPDLAVTLVEPLLRRTTFLEEAVSRLDLGNVTVVRARAEDVTAAFDVVTSRAVAPLDRLSRWCLPLVRPGGEMLAMKGSSATDEVTAARGVLRGLGGQDVDVVQTGSGVVDPAVTVVRVRRASR